MTFRAYRLANARYAESAFDGQGARRYGGRWNPIGSAVVYLADSLALAALEVLVHTDRPALLERYVWFEVRLPEALVLDLAPADLPDDWRRSPEPESTVGIGAAWLKSGASAVLRVPSVVVPLHHNFMLDPAHVDAAAIEIAPPQPFAFDRRLA